MHDLLSPLNLVFDNVTDGPYLKSLDAQQLAHELASATPHAHESDAHVLDGCSFDLRRRVLGSRGGIRFTRVSTNREPSARGDRVLQESSAAKWLTHIQT